MVWGGAVVASTIKADSIGESRQEAGASVSVRDEADDTSACGVVWFCGGPSEVLVASPVVAVLSSPSAVVAMLPTLSFRDGKQDLSTLRSRRP